MSLLRLYDVYSLSRYFKTLLKPLSKSNRILQRKMANSKFEYVKQFELNDTLLPDCWIVVRVDGKAFHKFSTVHEFLKPNDIRALNLMNRAAIGVMEEFNEILIAYGQSDEYSFIFKKDTALYNRRMSKIMSIVTSTFTSQYIYHWNKYFDIKLKYPPCFDGRSVLYPSDENLIDYMSWRQADVHINNLYNTCFWNLVQRDKLSPKEAEKYLSGTLSADKNEILFSKYNINYNNEPSMFRKGTTLLRKQIIDPSSNHKCKVIMDHYEDMIKDAFWKKHYELLDKKGTIQPSSDNISLLVMEQLERRQNRLHNNKNNILEVNNSICTEIES